MKQFNRKRSIAALTLATAMLLTACGGGTTVSVNDMSEADKKIADAVKKHQYPFVPEGEDISVTIGVGSNSNVSDFDTNKFTLWLEKQTGLDLKFNVFAEGMEKVKIMLAADDDQLPEMFSGFQFDDGTLIKYGAEGEGIFVDLGPYMDEYGYYIDNAIEKSKVDVEKFLLSADGHRYFMPYIVEQEGNVYSGKAWINKTWLNKLGLKMPTTTEELRSVLKEFVTKDPNGNGKKDELGITGAKDGYRQIPWHFLMNSFIYDDQSNYYNVDNKGKLSLAYTKDEFKEGLKYIHSLAKEGLFDTESFSQDNATLKTVCQLDDNIVGMVTTGSPDNIFSAVPERMLDYEAIPNLKGPKGVAWAFRQARDARVNGTVTKYCKNPLAAFALMDFMLSKDASIFARYGEEGPDWRKATDKDKSLFENIGIKATIVPILQYGSPQNSHWQAANPQFRYSEIADGMAWDGNPTNGEKIKADAITAYYEKGPDKIVQKQLFTEEENEEFVELNETLKTFLATNIASFITGTRDIDKEWDKFQQELKSYNVDRFLELSQIGYDRFEKGKAR